MPRLALGICLLWFVSLFVARTWVQLRRTGKTGMKGFHGAPGSLPWLAGVSASAGLVLLVANGFALAAALLTAVGIEIQVRAVEEPYLLEGHGERYRRYASRVGRFVPGIGRLSVEPG